MTWRASNEYIDAPIVAVAAKPKTKPAAAKNKPAAVADAPDVKAPSIAEFVADEAPSKAKPSVAKATTSTRSLRSVKKTKELLYITLNY
jgi:hypothetical protein